ncbi:MAG: pitrilysin family protein [Woeseiaceae bacterium]|nr:pitrilysin family protein [Woeseiaceae bacterium]
MPKIRLLAITSLLALVTACGRPPADAPNAGAEKLTIPDSLTLVEAVVKTPDREIVIPYRKYVMDNGLTVILHEDDSDPITHVDVTYHVGSAREDIGKSGFAHFFEHMMFEGTENAADGEHARIIVEAGGTYNGSTNVDRTNYFQTVPANQLEKILWLEADRMGFLLDAVTQEKFEIQRATVKNERGYRVDNQPYGRVYERVAEALYPEGHPYSWPTIGYIEDLERVGVNDLKAFFLRWYGPNNATLTIGGRFDEAEVLAWVDKYFGPIPRGPEVEPLDRPVVALESDRYLSLEDRVALPLLFMAFPTVHAMHEDEAPLDVFTEILGMGETSLLYKNLVKTQLAVQAGTSHYCQELACMFAISVYANPEAGKGLAEFEALVRESMREFEERGVQPDDLERVKMDIVSGKIYGLESVAGKVSQLAFYETFAGDPDYTAEDIARYENVTAEDVVRVYERYIKGKPAVIMSTVPAGQRALVAKPDTWQRPERKLPEYDTPEESELAYRRAEDDFDRSAVPPAGENPTLTLPEIWRAELDNGIEVLGALNAETPTAAIRLRIEAGQRHEPLDKLGLAALTAEMLNESTTESSNEELSNALAKLGSSVRFGAGNEATTLTIRSLSWNLDATLAIAAEQLLQPAFEPDDFEKVKAQLLQVIRHSKTQPATTAATVYQHLLFGRDNAFSYLNIGTEETVANLTLDDVKTFYAEHYAPGISDIVAVSDQDRAALLEKLAVFADWEGEAAPDDALARFPKLPENTIHLVDRPGSAQSEIRIGRRAMPYDATGRYYRARLMNFPLGGGSHSRIYQNLREDKGFTYGAYSQFNGEKDFGSFTAQAAVRQDATAAAIREFEKEIRTYAAEGITEPELSFLRSAIGQRSARDYETPSQKLGFLGQILVYDLDTDFVQQQNEILASIGKAEIDALAKDLLVFDEMVILVVGDAAVVRPQLEALGYEIVELDADGKPATST